MIALEESVGAGRGPGFSLPLTTFSRCSKKWAVCARVHICVLEFWGPKWCLRGWGPCDLWQLGGRAEGLGLGLVRQRWTFLSV